jgi:hypothetical protein
LYDGIGNQINIDPLDLYVSSFESYGPKEYAVDDDESTIYHSNSAVLPPHFIAVKLNLNGSRNISRIYIMTRNGDLSYRWIGAELRLVTTKLKFATIILFDPIAFSFYFNSTGLVEVTIPRYQTSQKGSIIIPYNLTGSNFKYFAALPCGTFYRIVDRTQIYFSNCTERALKMVSSEVFGQYGLQTLFSIYYSQADVYNLFPVSAQNLAPPDVIMPYILISNERRIRICEITVYTSKGKLDLKPNDLRYGTFFFGQPETYPIDGSLKTCYESYDQVAQFFGVRLPLDADVTNITVSFAQNDNLAEFIGARISLVTSKIKILTVLTLNYKS